MDVTPQLLREVEFREQWRGYNQDEVDSFLERLAVALEQLQDRLRDANERAQRAERRVVDTGENDELRKTLVLAQRTADAAVSEAQAEAEKLRAEAEERARVLVAEAEERASEMDATAAERSRSELGGLAARRADLQADADALRRFVEEQRARLRDELHEQLSWLEAPGRLSPATPPAMRAPADVVPPEPEPAPVVAGDESPFAPPGAALLDDDGEDHSDDTPAPGLSLTMPIEAVEPDPDDTEDEVDVHEGATPADGGVLAAAVADDPFLAELRRAVDDPEPLGPRDNGPRENGTDEVDEDDEDGELAGYGRFRRHRRRH